MYVRMYVRTYDFHKKSYVYAAMNPKFLQLLTPHVIIYSSGGVTDFLWPNGSHHTFWAAPLIEITCYDLTEWRLVLLPPQQFDRKLTTTIISNGMFTAAAVVIVIDFVIDSVRKLLDTPLVSSK
jgi:hypothetical protein